MTRFQEEFKRLRNVKGMTQEQLGTALGVSRSTIGMYEQGNREPDFESLEMIADYFNVPISSFFNSKVSNKDLYLNRNCFCDLSTQCHDQGAHQLVSEYLKLDHTDRGIIYGEIRGMLRNDKYGKNAASGL